MVKRLPAMQETRVRSLGWEDPLEKEMTTPSSILAWRIPWTEEPGRLQSTGVAKSWTQVSNFIFTFIVFKNYHYYKNLLSGIQRVNNLTSLCQPILFYFSKFFSTKPWHNSGLVALVFCILWAISFHVSHSVSDCGFFFFLIKIQVQILIPHKK